MSFHFSVFPSGGFVFFFLLLRVITFQILPFCALFSLVSAWDSPMFQLSLVYIFLLGLQDLFFLTATISLRFPIPVALGFAFRSSPLQLFL